MYRWQNQDAETLSDFSKATGSMCPALFIYLFVHLPHIAGFTFWVCSWDLRSEGFTCENFSLTVDTSLLKKKKKIWAEVN